MRRDLKSAIPAALLALTLLVGVQTTQAQAPVDAGLSKAGDLVITALQAHDPAAIEARFDDTMRQVLPHDRFAMTLDQIDMLWGKLESCAAPAVRSRSGIAQVDYRCTFANATMTLRLAWNDRLQLAGMFLIPAPPEPSPLPANVREEPIVAGADGWPLPGTLTMPADRPKPPFAVFVHGSGPADRDETSGPNRPFRDLAVGLAQHGIGSLRYEKRTHALGARFAAELKDPTLDDEIVDDAVAALALLAKRPGVGPLFIVGHSEGAWLAPRIARVATIRGLRVAGIVMLAAPSTPLADVYVDQYEFQATLPSSGVTQAMVDDMKVRRDNVAKLAAGTEGASAPALPDDLPASLWRDIAGYDPGAALLAQPKLPALLVFGDRDFQVPIREKALWEARLRGRGDTTIVAFPKLNHLLIDGEGPPSPAEYSIPGHVAQQLVERVSRWVGDEASERRP